MTKEEARKRLDAEFEKHRANWRMGRDDVKGIMAFGLDKIAEIERRLDQLEHAQQTVGFPPST